MSLETLLISVPVEQWKTRQAVVFDWYDGPRSGIVALDNPGHEYTFNLLAERPTEDGLDERLFSLSSLPPGYVDAIVERLRLLGVPQKPVWAPTWRFPTAQAQETEEKYISHLLSCVQPLAVVISTSDMVHFQGCWKMDHLLPNTADWFSAVESLAQPTR